MTLLIFILLLLSCLCYFFKKKSVALVTLTLTLILFYTTGTGLMGTWLLLPLNVADAYQKPIWQAQNILLVLGAGTIKQDTHVLPGNFAYSRLNSAAIMYFDCKRSQHECKILLSGGDAIGNGQSEATVYQNNLLQLGVATQDIILETQSKNTFENAKFSNVILQQHPTAKIFLITSSFHLQRALLYLSHFNIHPNPIAADSISSFYSWLPKGYNFAVADFALHEHLGIFRYHFYTFMGWNDD